MTDKDGTWLKDLQKVRDILHEEFCLLTKGQIDFHSSIQSQKIKSSSFNQIERRVMIRSAFAVIEAEIFAIKKQAVERPGPGTLSPGEIALAREVDYELADNGTVIERAARLQFSKNLRFAFNCFEKQCGAEHHLNVAGIGWQSLQRAIKVRHRVTHPKWPKDLEVTDNELHDTFNAMIWFHDQVLSLLQRGTEALLTHANKLNAETIRLKDETEILKKKTRYVKDKTKKISRNRSMNDPSTT